MIRHLRITVVVDNLVRGRSLLGEHGWAVWIEADERRILFDTGQGRVLGQNLEALQIEVGRADAIVFSHGHYDHTGGLPMVANRALKARFHLHPAAIEAKYTRGKQPPYRFIGMSEPVAEIIRSLDSRVVWTRQPTQISEGVFVTGEIPRRTSFEDVGGAFYIDADCTRPDPLVDDQAMYMETASGWVVLLGCAHAGVVNTLDHIAGLTGQDRFHAVIGGMHLLQASPDRLTKTVEALTRYRVRHLVPGHCTGTAASARLWSEFPNQWHECAAGARFDLDES